MLLKRINAASPHNETQDAFEAFYRSETARLITFVMYLGARIDDATDVAQQAMLEAFRSWEVIDNPRAWVRTVASRLWARQRFTDVLVEHVPDSPAHSSTDDALHLADEQQRVLDLLRVLPPAQSQALAWTYDGYIAAEIEAHTGIPSEQISSNLYKARKTVNKLLGAPADRVAGKENQR